MFINFKIYVISEHILFNCDYRFFSSQRDAALELSCVSMNNNSAPWSVTTRKNICVVIAKFSIKLIKCLKKINQIIFRVKIGFETRYMYMKLTISATRQAGFP